MNNNSRAQWLEREGLRVDPELSAILLPAPLCGSERGDLICVPVESDGVFLLRKQRAYLSLAETKLRLRAHWFACQHGAPVVPLHPCMAAGPLFDLSGHAFEVQQWIFGKPLSVMDCEDLHLAVVSLAHFHETMGGFDAPKPIEKTLHLEPRERFSKAHYHWPLLVGALATAASASLLAEISFQLERAEAAVAHTRARTSDREGQIFVHGDPVTENLIRSEAGIFLLDLDDLHLADREEDLAWMIAEICSLDKGRDHLSIRPSLCEKTVLDLFEAYHNTYPLSAIACERFPHFCTASIACLLTDSFFDDDGELLVAAAEYAKNVERSLHLIDQFYRVFPP